MQDGVRFRPRNCMVRRVCFSSPVQGESGRPSRHVPVVTNNCQNQSFCTHVRDTSRFSELNALSTSRKSTFEKFRVDFVGAELCKAVCVFGLEIVRSGEFVFCSVQETKWTAVTTRALTKRASAEAQIFRNGHPANNCRDRGLQCALRNCKLNTHPLKSTLLSFGSQGVH